MHELFSLEQEIASTKHLPFMFSFRARKSSSCENVVNPLQLFGTMRRVKAEITENSLSLLASNFCWLHLLLPLPMFLSAHTQEILIAISWRAVEWKDFLKEVAVK